MVFYVGDGTLVSCYYDFVRSGFTKAAPKRINYIFGYRTELSMKNRDTWEFAHKYFGKLWFRLGLLLIPITVIPMLFVNGNSENVVATVGLIVSFVNTVTLIIPIFFTEKALNKAFDKDGNRKVE